MAEPAPQKTTMEELRKGFNGDAGKRHELTVEGHPGDPDSFPSWPDKVGETLPVKWLDDIRAARAAAPLLTFKTQSRVVTKGQPAVPTGYSYGGEKVGKTPTEIYTAEEAKNERLRNLVLKVYDEMHEEGGISAVMTGDAAIFTWGRGISFFTPALAISFRAFLLKSPEARTALLDCGITILGSKNDDWRIVDLQTGTVKAGKAAVESLNGTEPALEKQQTLSAIAKITADHLQEATDAQWPAFKQKFMYTGDQTVPADVIATWPPEAAAYVVHLGAFGNFVKGWDVYGPTKGDPAKILRIAAQRYAHEDKGGHILVPAQSGSSFPSTTLLFGMGKQMMVTRGIVKPLPGYPGSAQQGDVVFEIAKARQTAKTGTHMVLRAPPAPFDPEAWVKANFSKSMADLLAACEALGYDPLRRTRDWYARIDSATGMPAEPYGPRPRLAMDAVLHKGEKENGRWVLEAAERAGYSPSTEWADQYRLLKAKIGIA